MWTMAETSAVHRWVDISVGKTDCTVSRRSSVQMTLKPTNLYGSKNSLLKKSAANMLEVTHDI